MLVKTGELYRSSGSVDLNHCTRVSPRNFHGELNFSFDAIWFLKFDAEICMRPFNIWFPGIVVALLLISFNCAAQKVTTTSDKSFDFKSAKKYSWGKNHIITRQGRKNDVLIDQQIVQEVNRNLKAKGFIEDPTTHDFYVSYDAGSGDPDVDVEGAYVNHPSVTTTTIPPVYGIPQNVWYSVDGHITFHVVDAKSNKIVWTAVATKKIRDPHKAMKNMPKQIEQMVSKTFKKFPPKNS
jgi:hypothetical protein